MIRNLIPHMYVDTSPFILNDPLIQKTAPIRKGIKNMLRTKTQLRDALLFTFRELSPFLDHDPAMKKRKNISETLSDVSQGGV